MIARTWRGWTAVEDTAAYADYIYGTGIEEYLETPGNRGAWLLHRRDGDRTEFIALSLWERREDIHGFAGDDIAVAVFYPEDDRFLVDRETFVRHYEVAEPPDGTAPVPAGLVPIGRVESPLTDLAAAPRQPDEGAPPAWLVLDASVHDGMRDLQVGDVVVVVTWLDRADREVLAVHPRDDQARPLTGVFSTRSPDRPNPIGLHEVEITGIDGARIAVRGIEALHGTPVLDIKPVLAGPHQR